MSDTISLDVQHAMKHLQRVTEGKVAADRVYTSTKVLHPNNSIRVEAAQEVLRAKRRVTTAAAQLAEAMEQNYLKEQSRGR